jgi:hypothetical protein
MNSRTSETILQYAKDLGAIAKCPHCLEYYVRTNNDAAKRMLYARVTNAHEDGVFLGDAREDIMATVKGVLQDHDICPGCASRDEA